MRKIAFTLAEVLITLTIIGVIAAITIPNLMQKYKKHQVEVQVKTAYSILNNALNMARAEYGSFEEITETTNAQSPDEKSNYFMENYLKPYIKHSKSCTVNGCPQTPIFEETGRVKQLDGTTLDWGMLIPNTLATMALDNGMLLGFSIFSNGNDLLFMVDINGKKGPNQLCYDTFYFSLFTYNNKNMLVGGAISSESDYLHLFTQLDFYKNSIYAGSPNGRWCTTAIQINGWKIPDDYPVKKF